MNKRQITLAELEEELRVGTVDLSTIEIRSDGTITAPQPLDDSNTTPPEIIADQGDTGLELGTATEGLFILAPPLPEADEFLANLAAQADKAIATIPPDVRADVAASVADGEEIEDIPGSEFEAPQDLLDSATPDAPPGA